MIAEAPIRIGSIPALAKKLQLARADESDLANRCGHAVFWIGAGASISAGVPSGRALAGRLALRIARGLRLLPERVDPSGKDAYEEALLALQNVEVIRRDHTLGSAYGDLFADLDAVQRRDFIRKVILETNHRQINWTHLALGELVRQRIVHTLLTTNFDDLLLDGLVRCDQLPAIIDGVESLTRMDPQPPVPQLVYLHGSQHTYDPRNSTVAVSETRNFTEAQGGLYGLLRQCSVLVVLGYAGNPGEGVMELLQHTCRALPTLPVFWVAHGQQDSLSDQAIQLLGQSTERWLIAGQDADLFFRELLRESRIGVPSWFHKPVDHLIQLAERIRVDDSAESAKLRDEVDDFRARLKELAPWWDRVGAADQERRELRQLLLSGAHEEVWTRLKGRALDDSTLLQMRADAAYELGRRGGREFLVQAVRDRSVALQNLATGTSEWAHAQECLGNALAAMGDAGDDRASRDAVAAYGHALSVQSRELLPLKWACLRNNQGLAWLALGEREGIAAPEQAIAAFEDALMIYRLDAMPVEWAASQCNLANALQTLAGVDRHNSEESIARLRQAVDLYTEALSVQTKSDMPTDWAMTTCNRANALLALDQLGDASTLSQALDSLDEAAQIVDRRSLPSHWALIRHTQGAAKLALGRRGDEASLRAGIVAIREALEAKRQDEIAGASIAISSNLGKALLELGRRGESRALGDALGILHDALEWLAADRSSSHAQDIEALAQHVFEELVRVASTSPAGTVSANAADASPLADRDGRRGASHVLVVEDDEMQQLLISSMLRTALVNVELRVQETADGALDDLARHRYDLMILDLNLPDMGGLDLFYAAKKTNPQLPIFVYSGDVRALATLRAQQLANPDPRLAVLGKHENPQEFVRLVPTLFNRRQGDVGVENARASMKRSDQATIH